MRLAAAMEADPDAGIIQSLPLIVNRNTLFARVQQFAARIAGPIIAAGLTRMDRGATAITGATTRSSAPRAFADHCGMPDLRGRPPFGGHILSHDFVEAALIRRAGWAVYMLPTLGGQLRGKPAVADRSRRARPALVPRQSAAHQRGCRARASCWRRASIFSPASWAISLRRSWMAQLIIGIVLVLQSKYIRPEYFTSDFSLFPTWPRFDYERALQLFELTIAILLAPEIPRPAVRADRRRTRAADAAARSRLIALDAARNPHLRRDRADHDADPVRLGVSDPFRPRHRLESAASRRRLDSVQEHRAPPPRAYGPGNYHPGRRRLAVSPRWSSGCRRRSPV